MPRPLSANQELVYRSMAFWPWLGIPAAMWLRTFDPYRPPFFESASMSDAAFIGAIVFLLALRTAIRRRLALDTLVWIGVNTALTAIVATLLPRVSYAA